MLEETVIINGCTVKIQYSAEKHPNIVSNMRDTLEKAEKRFPNPQQNLTRKDKNEII